VVRLARHASRGEPARRACQAYTDAGGRIEEFDGALPAADVIVDALFGIGLDRAPDADCAALIDAIAAHGAPVLALDVPSGLDADTGHAPGRCVRAQRTIEFIAPKAGLRTGAALDQVGARNCASLELDPEWLEGVGVRAHLLQPADLARWLRPRRRNSHKGSHGRVLCIGGDHGSGGAIMLCAEAALRCGAGLVDVATRELHVPALLARLPEAMAHVPTHRAQFDASLERADVIAVGPGLGCDEWGMQALERALARGKPLVLDADALNQLSREPRAGAVGGHAASW
jgi:NAD(P)H-hydrate epimerase